MRTIVVGSRRSALAMTQTRQVIARLEAAAASDGASARPAFVIREIVTKGDRISDRPLTDIGGKALFVKEIEQALLAGEIDFAVHSMKDMPSDLPDGLVIAAVPEREDPRDCLVSASGLDLERLPSGSRIGTSSLRRALQLKAFRPDLEVGFLRGNLDTRLRKLEAGEFDAVVVAAAGMHRMGWAHRITQYLDYNVCLPHIGQGALAIECRADDAETMAMLATIHHEPTAKAVSAERAFMARLGGGCETPLGAYARLENGRVVLEGFVASPDGSVFLRERAEGGDPETVGAELADRLLMRGAGRLSSAPDVGSRPPKG
ncbi:MAG: hydroxymethylbilane synthase [Candidatus Reconcilbacillus cellulovorans]|uniref:Porphobilinogen deaminase n=1 Tax=Candidatus Reconcilbacillus cellulovorans TaxID=1906605 RepID=A0A2A6E1X6_9BACL|nr:MAG: hydroxymethylbilane synthase [Candidatus Reconcilbacillus cellulovorans]